MLNSGCAGPELRWGWAMAAKHRDHIVEIYSDSSAYIAGLAAMVAERLAAGDAVLFAGTSEHRCAVADYLRSDSRGFDIAVAQGRFMTLDAAEALAAIQPHGNIDRASFVALVAPRIAQLQGRCGSIRRGRVLVIGELVHLLAGEGRYDDAVELERLWNDLAGLQSFELFCGYSAACLPADSAHYNAVCMEHSRVVAH